LRGSATVEFNRDVRPILAENCFSCHGPDKNRREAELRLDTEDGLLGSDGSSGVVVPRSPDESELYRRITSPDAEERMPPAESGKQLSPEEVELLRRWIEQGAEWQGHWAWQPIGRPVPPTTTGFRGENPVDAFIDAELDRLGLEPTGPANRLTLIRRLSLDLTGLPPDPAEADAFDQDSRPDAYERLVDRLLASPHFGERMSIMWLDLVRYADSVGYHGDQPVMVYPFRDYVIRAFNQNMPFDQFTVEQLAGDLVESPTLEQRIASGYNRLGMMSAEGGVQVKEYLAKYIAERVRNVSGAWMGVTMGCCECHDHKFDPFSSRDFYSMQAFFADLQEKGFYGGAHESGEWGPRVKVPDRRQEVALAELQSQIAEVKAQIDAVVASDEFAVALAQWEREHAPWEVLHPLSVHSQHGAELKVAEDGSVLVSGPRPDTDTYTVRLPVPSHGTTALRCEVLPDDSLPKKGPGRADNGNFVLTEFSARIQSAEGAESDVKLARAAATFEQELGGDTTPYGRWTAEGSIDGDQKGAAFGWAAAERAGQANHAVFETEADLSANVDGVLVVELRQNHGRGSHTIGRFRLSAAGRPRPVPAVVDPPAEIVGILASAPAARSPDQRGTLADHFRSITPLLAPARDRLEQLESARTALDKQIPTMLTSVSVSPRVIRVLKRGNWMDETGEIVSPAVPAVLPQPALTGERATRLDLAQWLVSEENPLTARVLANRLWKVYFGAGLSTRLDDVGAQGEWPSHPELLDYLAGRLINSGWDVKEMVRLMVTSTAYRRSSRASQELVEADPFNRSLARAARFRLDAEIVRDNALAVSGLLVCRVGGPSVKPYQPPGYWSYLNFPQREWQRGSGDELYRRGIYTHWQRQYLHPAMLAFDAPCREECTADRPRSNTPLQSLVVFNDPEFVETARALAERTQREGGSTPEDQISWAFRRAVTRPIGTDEKRLLVDLHAAELDHFRSSPDDALKLAAAGGRQAASGLDSAHTAAMISVCRAILGMHETMTRE
jgi:hypothetical protein